ncbi:hypothetical protein OF117_08145 [Geodermatophilus sp. YIM 151500]|nr:hypothetical protein [Geodermatophilus sp. YIM 151500]MCV2489335.1 hypothetical protein [Geodermatophilus sp. YIM 151500]
MDTLMIELHEHYVHAVNEAVAEDRMDRVEELSDQYLEEALQLILATA